MLKLKIEEMNGENIKVELPDSPDLIFQFQASIRRCKPGEKKNIFIIPVTAKNAVLAWLNIVSQKKLLQT